MKKAIVIWSITCLTIIQVASQDPFQRVEPRQWEIGISFGEIPIMAGSFKPGISFGYHFNDYLYVGGIYQIVDHIARNGNSFDAAGLGFENLKSSKERVAPRSMLQARLRPHRLAPFVSVGLITNGTDVETVEFGHANHQIGDHTYEGPITVNIARSGAVRPAIGFGYHYAFKNGIVVSTEWSFDWFHPVPAPKLEFDPSFEVNPDDLATKEAEITEAFQSNFHNRYHIFHLGLGYKF
ncbi:MAG: hypothetical protein AAGA85_06090 [Bacteroidota bacterium]